MATCPICKSEARALDKVGDPDGYECPKDGRFKVSGTVQATRKHASRVQWEAALQKARTRRPDEWAPVIVDDDFL